MKTEYVSPNYDRPQAKSQWIAYANKKHEYRQILIIALTLTATITSIQRQFPFGILKSRLYLKTLPQHPFYFHNEK